MIDNNVPQTDIDKLLSYLNQDKSSKGIMDFDFEVGTKFFNAECV